MSQTLKFDPSIRFAAALDVSVKSDSVGVVEGLAAAFGNVDRGGDVFRRGAFARTIREIADENIQLPMLWSHTAEHVIGHWHELRETERGLNVKGRLNLQTAEGVQAHRHIVAGDVSGLSVGFVLPPNGRRYLKDGVFEITDCDLVEVSCVAVPANPKARISNVKSIGTKAELADFLHDAGLAKTAAARVAASGWAGLNGDDFEAKAARLLTDVDRALTRLKGT
ncbi:HK97 family phage prohead protease [Sinorhizobium fredii]|uniref:HK97 family phage prohead protease n=1 Tax=Rhizobium fredii TaxID=380 RepID=UPI000595668C|nr:HK97 family phage prohead protease [Sinorhizobium fredii]WOS61377.1 HK97 family phage prohead protease [Sinorhizobium fredii GR64]